MDKKFEIEKTYSHGPSRLTCIQRTARTGIFRDENGNDLKARLTKTKWECYEWAVFERFSISAEQILK